MNGLWLCCACGDGPYKDPRHLVCLECQHKRCDSCSSELFDEDHQSNEQDIERARLTQHMGTLIAFSIAAGATLDAAKYLPSWSFWYCNKSAGDDALKSSLWNGRVTNGSTVCSHHVLIDAVAFTAATTGLYHKNQGHQVQDRFLLGGFTSGLAIGLGQGSSLQETIVLVLPWTILLSLAASQIWRAIIKSKRLYSNWKCPNCPANCIGVCAMEIHGT